MELFLIVSLLLVFGILFLGIARFRKKRETRNKAQEIHIDVIINNGIFEPATIKIPEEKILILRFFRKDYSGLADYLVFPQLGLHYYLPKDKPIEITIPMRALILGEIDFFCHLGKYTGSYQGKIFIKH